MRIRESTEKLSFENTLLEFLLVGSPLQDAAVAFDRANRLLGIRRNFLGKRVKEIPFSWIRCVRHHIEAINYELHVDGGLILRAYPLEAHASELSIELVDRKKEIVYRTYWHLRWFGKDGRDVIRFTQGMADRISAFTGIPGVIVSDELQGTFDTGSGQLTLHGECLPAPFKGHVIPFDDIRALRSIMTSKGYYAVEFCTKSRGVVLVNEGYASSTRLHETVKVIAESAGIPFELQTTDKTPSSMGRPYKPISPTARGSI
jgi:hypothetical protein